jgi:hypothetical protein
MSSALQKFVKAEQSGGKIVYGEFRLTDGAATIAESQHRSGLWSVTKTGTGIYTVTLANRYQSANEPIIDAWVRSRSASAPANCFVQAGLYTPATRSFVIFTGTTFPTLADLALATGPWIAFEAWFRDTSVA